MSICMICNTYNQIYRKLDEFRRLSDMGKSDVNLLGLYIRVYVECMKLWRYDLLRAHV